MGTEPAFLPADVPCAHFLSPVDGEGRGKIGASVRFLRIFIVILPAHGSIHGLLLRERMGSDAENGALLCAIKRLSPRLNK